MSSWVGRMMQRAMWALALPCFSAGCSDTVLVGSECQTFRRPCVDAGMDQAEAGMRPGAGSHDGSHPAADSSVPDAGDGGSCAMVLLPPPLARWTLDESSGTTAAETTGKGPAGTLVAFSAKPWSPGKVAGALRFDGVDDHVQMGAVSGQIKSLVFWLNPGSASVTTDRSPTVLPSAHGPHDGWTDPQNAYADDGVEASVQPSLVSYAVQDWGGFHLAQKLPSDAEILGITATVDTSYLGLLGAFGVELSWNGASSHTSAHYGWAQLIAGSTLSQAGGSDKLWGRAWSWAEFSDENFRVQASFGGVTNTMSIDYIAVTVQYAPYATPRKILQLNGNTAVAFASSTGKDLTVTGWPNAVIHVNGVAKGKLAAGWNHIAITSSTACNASDLQLGRASSAELAYSYAGLMDDVALFEQELTTDQIHALASAPACF